MSKARQKTYAKRSVDTWGNEHIAPGETKNIKLTVSESYSGMNVRIPIQVRRAKAEGPTVFVTAALHGDEINGTGAIRQLLHSGDLELLRGSLILVPVLNLLAFDRHSRYLPDRRDLNRFFPGSPDGSLASRMAHNLFNEIVLRSDYGIDLHTAAVRRTNYPNIRGDMSNHEVAKIARAFGSEIILDGKGPTGSFRREACQVDVPTIILEGGEVWKVEPSIVETTIQGIKNVLCELEMLDGTPRIPAHQIVINSSKWIRAQRGGFLQFHVKPGEIVEMGQPIATNTNLLGVEENTLVSPFAGIIIGMTTLPAVTPGESVCNIGRLPGSMRPQRMAAGRANADGIEERIVDQLGTNVTVIEKHD
ncbi:MAG: M14 family metallopeptidase [Pirellulaceae bacterium]